MYLIIQVIFVRRKLFLMKCVEQKQIINNNFSLFDQIDKILRIFVKLISTKH